MITAGLMALKDFPLAPDCFRDLCRRVDLVTLWVDRHADKRIVAATIAAKPPGCRLTTIRSRAKWNRWNWREEMIRSLDDVRLRPSYVLALDSDETFGDGFDSDFSDFRASGKDLMLFGYEMATADGREVPRYPRAAHCKAFRWRRGLSYQPYRGYAKPTLPGGAEPTVYRAESRIRHLCFWTAEMEAEKQLHK